MASFKVFLSTIADESMLHRHDPTNESVIAHRKAFLEAHDLPFDKSTRVSVNMLERATVTHDSNFCRYYTITDEMIGDGMEGKEKVVSDALVTTTPGHPIILPVADCVGAVLFDPAHSVLMVSHLGRHSLEQKGAVQSVRYLMDHYNSNPEDIQVWLSPAPSKEAYQIWALENKGMKEVTFEQLFEAGIKKENITNDSRDTITDLNFYSYSEFLKGNRNEDGDHMITAVIE